MTSLYIVGAGGLGRECLDVALALDRPVEAFLDDADLPAPIRGVTVARIAAATAGASYVIGIASAPARARIATELDRRGLHATALVHPRAIVGPETVVGGGSIVLGGAHVSSNVTLGAHAQVHYNATVGHDAVLEDCTAVFPGANVAGAVRLGPGSTVGSNAVVLQGLTVGAGAFVGAGAVVTRDVPPDTVVVGSPARPR